MGSKLENLVLNDLQLGYFRPISRGLVSIAFARRTWERDRLEIGRMGIEFAVLQLGDVSR